MLYRFIALGVLAKRLCLQHFCISIAYEKCPAGDCTMEDVTEKLEGLALDASEETPSKKPGRRRYWPKGRGKKSKEKAADKNTEQANEGEPSSGDGEENGNDATAAARAEPTHKTVAAEPKSKKAVAEPKSKAPAAESESTPADETPKSSGNRRRPESEKRRQGKSRSLSRDGRQMGDKHATPKGKGKGRDGTPGRTPGNRTIAAAHLSPRTPRRSDDAGMCWGGIGMDAQRWLRCLR